ncbi:peptidase M48 [Luteibacter rhizovicinus DSM 16549]|uniref:Putative beta-barrel assembly-enhancing protease n=1 Tax=Luteibacter rhizovicinus DSM 16549 TaxID=1440763 RepID=A0A0G9HBW8_9GAMM|nr:M48 family metalloprotease [Luteibacter rhizovicinus]APG02500.1 peptidase M48 [Luteibacter rhizovicinus DSM 16549]KLD67300.1 peptidase M48 [Luteibacter rhizovicinus DSM 16549]KLD74748.1 peptidase M48 [Xanthomonas hyacinthi DSM 19077]
MRKPLPRLALLAASTLATFAAGAQDNVRLPDLGSSAAGLLSPREANEYGAQMLRQMHTLNLTVDDALVDQYINDLGYRLVAASDRPKDHFQFFIVNDSQINAFAAPGGYIGVNAGLIDITTSESELAGVIAHEIGHITQNHLYRAFEDSKKNAPLMALVLLGAIAAGAGGGAGDAAPAVLMGGQGLIMQRQINFTRKDEIEADRTGIQTLANAGYDPEAMAEFFGRMQDTLRVGEDEEAAPSLLLTHPVTLERISDAKARARVITERNAGKPRQPTLDKASWEKSTAPVLYVKDNTQLAPNRSKIAPDSAGDTYALMRERIRVLSGDARKLADIYATNLKRKDFDTAANRYGYAIALIRSGHGMQAVEQIQPLLVSQPASVVLRLALADAYVEAGRHGDAMAIYKTLHENSPRNGAVTLGYARALTDTGRADESRTAATLLRPMLDDSDDPEIFRTFARASERSGDSVRAAEAYADSAYLAGRPFDAMEQLRRLLKRDDLDYYQRSRIQARISDLTPLLLELRKKRVTTDDNPDGRSQ